MNDESCVKCQGRLNEKGVCPNCGWMAFPHESRKRSAAWNTFLFFAVIVGMCGACGYVAYAGSGAIFGFGPLIGSPWVRGIALGLIALYVLVAFGRARRRR